VGMIPGQAISQSDVFHLSLVQRSWRGVVQAELFRNVCISSACKSEHFVMAFISNIGPGNPKKSNNCWLL
jgi:hypothetical protein